MRQGNPSSNLTTLPLLLTLLWPEYVASRSKREPQFPWINYPKIGSSFRPTNTNITINKVCVSLGILCYKQYIPNVLAKSK